ncbi:hypothetical protein Zmor_015475 [Zophobas morio]|uniref:Peptidase S1 domain-containing protein n=1 Tax=Zophobas morio TaxID=2755281 RepID=A0AA38MHH1_9CUCU|nr:hypothetical protein Zmor_015475 [Zophobas morio]
MKTALIFVLCLSPIWAISRGARIIGGQDSYAGEFPYAAAIYKSTAEGNYFCTGSVLNKEWIITAGQCVDGALLFTILLGTHKLNGDEASVHRVATEHYVLHPDYNPDTLAHDIGLIKFRAPITFTTYIRNLYLPYAGMHDDTSGIAYGWGQISDDVSDLSDTLNYVTLKAVSDAECRITYGGQLVENMVCFEGNYNEGTCFGDSGSPIIQHASRGYTIIVAVSTFFSSNGCESIDPSGYTKVFPYNDWINNVTKTQYI